MRKEGLPSLGCYCYLKILAENLQKDALHSKGVGLKKCVLWSFGAMK